MNDNKLKQLTSFATFGFAAFCILWVVLSLVLLPVAEGQNDYSILVTDSQWTLVSLSGLLSAVFGIFAIFGIYFTNRDRGGLLLFIGTVILVMGILFEFTSLTWEVFIWPVLCSDSNYLSFVQSGIFVKSPQFMVFILLMLMFLLGGNFIVAISFLKNKIYGKLIPWLMISGVLLYGIGNLSVIYIASIGLCIYCLAFILIGIHLMKLK